MLLLFDIDGTLLSTAGAGLRAMERAGRDLFDPDYTLPPVSFAGRLDPLIIADLHASAGRPATLESMSAFRARYHAHLPAALDEHRDRARALPGAAALVDAARARIDAGRAGPGAAMGLLTGNYAETGTLKLRAVGLDPGAFTVNAWGDDSPSAPPTRDDLPRVAMHRHAHARNAAPDPARTVIIGDTPHDVRCARVNGCRCLAVATGQHRLAELRECGADWAVEDLSQTAELLEWMFNPR